MVKIIIVEDDIKLNNLIKLIYNVHDRKVMHFFIKRLHSISPTKP